MILYFANRKLDIIGMASTSLPEGLVVVDDLKTEDVKTGVAAFECRIPYDKKTRAEVENFAAVGNFILRSNGKEKEFYTIIDSEADTKSQEVYVYAEDAGLDLLNEIVGDYAADKAYNIAHYINLFAADSGFEIGLNEASTLTRKLSWEGEATVTERLASVATQFDNCEISYSFEIDGLFVSKKFINIHKKRGKDAGVQLRLNYDIDRIITKKSIANLATALQCVGGIPEDKEEEITLKGYKYDDGDFYVDNGVLKSREALKKWGRFAPNTSADRHIVKKFSYDTTSQATLCAHAITELKKLREIEVNYEVDINKLPEGTKIGDRVNIVDDAGELYVSARILLLETSIVDDKHSATIGEYLIKGSGISQKVEAMAAEFAKYAISAQRAKKIADEAKTLAESANTQAQSALDGVKEAQTAVDEAKAASSAATQAAEQATAAANAAQSVVAGVEEAVEAIEQTVANAEAAAEQARQAAATAETKATEAHTAATNAATKADQAAQAAGTATEKAETAEEKAEAAQADATQAKTDAQAASQTAAAAKLDAEQAQKDIDALGENLTTLESTMQADYARKTDLTETEASLQSQITQNAAQIASTVSRVQTIDETANNASTQAQAAQKAAQDAQADADKAQADATAAQTAATNAANAASAAQSEADKAKAAAATAQSVADKAQSDLEAAQADLATVQGRVDATEADILAAQQKVNEAQEAAEAAQAEADSAAQTAANAQSAAQQAVTDASNAQTVANNAATQATLAQQVANEAKGNAEEAKEIADQAKANATAAQTTANTAKTNAEAAQTAANEAAAAASEAQQAAEAADAKAAQAQSDLEAAEQNLADVTSRVGTTEEEVEAAKAAVVTAQAAADKAKADAATAQSTADTAKTNAANAQTLANNAKSAADAAQKAADDAKDAADKAQEDVDALAVRMTSAETSITQNAEQIALRATKEEVAETLGGYSTKEETEAALTVKAGEILAEVGETFSTKEEHDLTATEIRETIANQNTSIMADTEQIILSALESYTQTGDFDSFKEATSAQLQLLSEQMELKFTQSMQQLENVNGTLQEQINTITKYFTFDVNGLTIGQVDNPYKVIIDNDRYSMTVNGVEVMWIADGKVFTPEIEVTRAFKLFDYLIDQDENGRVNCAYVGGE